MKKGSGRAHKTGTSQFPPPRTGPEHNAPKSRTLRDPPFIPNSPENPSSQTTTRCKNGSGMIMITTSYNDKTSSGARAYNNNMRKYTLGRDCLPAQDTSTRIQHTNRRHFEP